MTYIDVSNLRYRKELKEYSVSVLAGQESQAALAWLPSSTWMFDHVPNMNQQYQLSGTSGCIFFVSFFFSFIFSLRMVILLGIVKWTNLAIAHLVLDHAIKFVNTQKYMSPRFLGLQEAFFLNSAVFNYWHLFIFLLQLFDGKDGKPKYPWRWVILPPFL